MGKVKEDDDIKEAILAGKRIVNGKECSTDDTGRGIVGSDTAGEQLPICILEVSVMLLGQTFDLSVTGEISSPAGFNCTSEMERVLLGLDFGAKIEGVICNDLLLPSHSPESTYPTDFNKF